jgi:hypothetical protein
VENKRRSDGLCLNKPELSASGASNFDARVTGVVYTRAN